MHAGDGQRTARSARGSRCGTGSIWPLVTTDALDDTSAGGQVCETEGAIETSDSFDYIEDDGCICVLGAKTFVVWRRGPDARLLGILKEAMRTSMEREGGKLTFLAIVEAGSATVPIDRDTRRVNTEIFRMLGTAFAARRRRSRPTASSPSCLP